MNKLQTIVSGIRVSGKMHVGNYLGVIKDALKLQNEGHKCFYFIADLHGLTTPFKPQEFPQTILDVAATWLAAGIDPEKTVFFLQNQVLEHATMAWIFNCITPLGELYRMTQFKEKSDQHKNNINAGLLTYPSLMAADILIYKPTLIPVGEDQTQHVELARVVAKKFNHHFGQTFPEPKTLLTKPLRVKSLAYPEKKMSKTGDEALNLDDEPAEILRKLKKAVTASEPGKKSPGVENLFFLLEQFGTQEEVNFFRQEQKNDKLKFSELKETLAKEVGEYFADFRKKKTELLNKPEYLAEILGEGSYKARQVASQTLVEVKEKIGLL